VTCVVLQACCPRASRQTELQAAVDIRETEVTGGPLGAAGVGLGWKSKTSAVACEVVVAVEFVEARRSRSAVAGELTRRADRHRSRRRSLLRRLVDVDSLDQ
jgi:hypothetical protein